MYQLHCLIRPQVDYITDSDIKNAPLLSRDKSGVLFSEISYIVKPGIVYCDRSWPYKKKRTVIYIKITVQLVRVFITCKTRTREQKYKIKRTSDAIMRVEALDWSEWRDLNPRPLPPQGSALPPEPHPDSLCCLFSWQRWYYITTNPFCQVFFQKNLDFNKCFTFDTLHCIVNQNETFLTTFPHYSTKSIRVV